MRRIDFIVIHSADWPNGKPLTVETVDEWHGEPVYKNGVKIREHKFIRKEIHRQAFNPGLPYIGYQYFIDIDGNIHTGRSEEEIGAHVQGFNSTSIGICLAGRDKFTKAQWIALKSLVSKLKQKYPSANIKGHRDFSPDKDGDGVIEPSEWMKSCPGFPVAEWVRNGMTPNIKNVLV